MHGDPSHHRKTVALGVLVTLLWASTFVLVKSALADLPPLTFGGLLYFTAFLALAIRRWRSPDHAPLRQLGWDRWRWRWVAALGFLTYALVPAALCLSLSQLPAVTFNFVFQLGMPLTVALLSGLLLGERTSVWQWTGIGALAAGLYLFFDASLDPARLAGLGLAGLTGAGVGLSNLITRHLMRDGRSRALDVSTISMGIGSVALLAVALQVEQLPSFSAKGLLILAWVALANTAFAFTLWNHVLRTLTALEAGVLSSLQVVVVLLLARIFLGERLSPAQLPASALIVLGVAAVHLQRGLGPRKAPDSGPA